MVTAEGGDNRGLVGEDDLVLGAGREETLKQSDGGVEYDSALSASLDADLDLAVVDEIGADALDVRGGLAVEVGRADEGAQAMGFDLSKTISERFRPLP